MFSAKARNSSDRIFRKKMKAKKKFKAVLTIPTIAVKRGFENPHQLHLETGISVPRMNKMWENKSPVIRLEDIEVICRTLCCKPRDIIEIVPESPKK